MASRIKKNNFCTQFSVSSLFYTPLFIIGIDGEHKSTKKLLFILPYGQAGPKRLLKDAVYSQKI